MTAPNLSQLVSRSEPSRDGDAASEIRNRPLMVDPPGPGPQWIPVNVFETPDSLVVVAPMPAVRADDVSVRLDGRRLRLSASCRTAAPKRYLRREWDYGRFERSLQLPAGCRGTGRAVLGNGQLVVTLPRAAAGELGRDDLTVNLRVEEATPGPAPVHADDAHRGDAT